MDAIKKPNGKITLEDLDADVAFCAAYALEYYARNGASGNAPAFRKANAFFNKAIDTREMPEEFFGVSVEMP